MSDRLLVEYGSTTLAGLKSGCIFTVSYNDKKEIYRELRNLNKRLTKFGLRVIPLRFSKQRVLIYLYRPSQLEESLNNIEVQQLLKNIGYQSTKMLDSLKELGVRLRCQKEFPHEIGLFLGYPLDDVKAFIENKRECVYVGTWKVYSNLNQALQRFEQFRKCKEIYLRRINQGAPIESLVVNTI